MDYPVFNETIITCFGKKIVVGLRRGTSDQGEVKMTMERDAYNFRAIPFKDDDVVIDIGAHIGGESLFLASLDQKLKIYAYEALPENVDLLQKNALQNGFSNIFPFLLAVGGKIGKRKIYYGDEDTEKGRPWHFGGNAYRIHRKEFYEVETITLEKIFLDNKIERCRLIKIDCEGCEYETLKNCPPEILKKVDYIVGEHHYNTRKEIFELTDGLFEDVPCPGQKDGEIGLFFFKNKNL